MMEVFLLSEIAINAHALKGQNWRADFEHRASADPQVWCYSVLICFVHLFISIYYLYHNWERWEITFAVSLLISIAEADECKSLHIHVIEENFVLFTVRIPRKWKMEKDKGFNYARSSQTQRLVSSGRMCSSRFTIADNAVLLFSSKYRASLIPRDGCFP